MLPAENITRLHLAGSRPLKETFIAEDEVDYEMCKHTGVDI